MLSMFGFIKKELDKQKKLPAKFGGWKNILFDAYAGTEYTADAIPARNHISLFSPFKNKEIPIDLYSKSWEFSCKVNVSKKGSGYPQQAVAVYGPSGSRLVCIVKCGSTFDFLEWSSGTYVRTGYAGSSVIGSNWIKLVYMPKTSTSGTFTGYYSMNGSSWNRITSWNYTKLEENFRLCNIAIINGGPPDIPADSSSVPVSSIKFIYDGEVLFGK